MDRNVSQDGADFQDRTVNIDLVFTAGTSGAVPASFTYSAGVASVALSSTNYVVTLQDGYVAYLNGHGNVIQASYATTGATRAAISAQNVTGTTPTVTLTCYNASGTAVAMATGDQLSFTIRLKR